MIRAIGHGQHVIVHMSCEVISIAVVAGIVARLIAHHMPPSVGHNESTVFEEFEVFELQDIVHAIAVLTKTADVG